MAVADGGNEMQSKTKTNLLVAFGFALIAYAPTLGSEANAQNSNSGSSAGADTAGAQMDYIVGNSMGAIVGGLFASGVPLDHIEKVMEDMSLRKAYLPGWIPPKVLMAPFLKMRHPVDNPDCAGLFGTKTFDHFLA